MFCEVLPAYGQQIGALQRVSYEGNETASFGEMEGNEMLTGRLYMPESFLPLSAKDISLTSFNKNETKNNPKHTTNQPKPPLFWKCLRIKNCSKQTTLDMVCIRICHCEVTVAAGLFLFTFDKDYVSFLALQ